MASTYFADGCFRSTCAPMQEIKIVKTKADLPYQDAILYYLTNNYGSLTHAVQPHNIRMAAELRTMLA